MKEVKAIPVYAVEGQLYTFDRINKKIEIGSIIYDSRYRDFFLIENEGDLQDISYVAPELCAQLKKYES